MRISAIPGDCQPSWNRRGSAAEDCDCRRRPGWSFRSVLLQKDGLSGNGIRERVSSGRCAVNGIPSSVWRKYIDAESRFSRQMGVTFKCGVEVGKDVTIQQLREEGFKAFYVAIGAQGGRKAGVPGEDADGVKTVWNS